MFHPIIISGPSGAGKDTAIKRLIGKRKEIHDAVGFTTRQLRDGEVNGVDISSVSRTMFEKMIKNNELIEYTEYAGNYYGMPFLEVRNSKERQTIFNVGVSAAEVIKRYDNESITILVLPQSKEELLKRLGNRGYERFMRAKSDIVYASTFFEYVVITKNDKYDEIVTNLECIIDGKGDSFKLKQYYDFIKTFFD